MNWLIVGALLGAMAGGFFYIVAPNGEYIRHLTPTEKATLATGKPVLKAHRAYNNIWKKGYHEGPLKVVRLADGKLAFTPYGHWEQFDKGRLTSNSDYYGAHHSITRVFDEAGGITDLIKERPMIFAGDTAVETRIIYLNVYNLTDTLAVDHWFRSLVGKPVGKDFWSFDERGKRPVPTDWKFKRY